MTDPRRSLTAVLTALLLAPGASSQISLPRAAARPALGGLPSLSAVPVAPPLPAAVPLPAAPAALAAPVAADPLLPAPEAADPVSALESLRASAAPSAGPRAEPRSGSELFDGAGARGSGSFVVNDEGVRISGRAATYYREVRRMVGLYKDKINLQESLDVMDDAYADVLAKVSAVEAVARGRGLSQENTHLEETLTWVDGILSDGAKTVAVHTHRVYFHKARDPRSEIAEGIRRVDGYIEDAVALFKRGGAAERQMGRIDEVELVFDARGYREIKEHLTRRGAEISALTGGRVKFKLLDELAAVPREQAEVRSRLNELARRYNGAGLSKIYEGVIYSRYVGLLLELKTLEHYHRLGYRILQSGRELFDANGMYVTELDVVVESPDGKVLLVEAKSARVGLPRGEVLRDKVLYKLDTYRAHRAALEAMIGRPIDAVVFSMDVAVDVAAAASGRAAAQDRRKLELAAFLRDQEGTLSARYGWPVSFLFLQSGPGGSGPARGRRSR